MSSWHDSHLVNEMMARSIKWAQRIDVSKIARNGDVEAVQMLPRGKACMQCDWIGTSTIVVIL